MVRASYGYADNPESVLEDGMMSLRRRLVWLGCIPGLFVLGGGGALPHAAAKRGGPEKTLYIWTGDQARIAPDFLTVVNFDEDSREYGHIVTTVPVTTAGNEAHHCH